MLAPLVVNAEPHWRRAQPRRSTHLRCETRERKNSTKKAPLTADWHELARKEENDISSAAIERELPIGSMKTVRHHRRRWRTY